MKERATSNNRRPDKVVEIAPFPAIDHWYGKLGLLLLSVILLSFSFAPFSQFYLAWIGLVPWLFLLSRSKHKLSAFLWSWLGGSLFFTANMWWLVYVTGPGMIALMVMLGMYWGLAALFLHPIWRRDRRDKTEQGESGSGTDRFGTFSISLPLRILLTATVWTAFEWMRGNYPFNGLPWLFLGHAQSPILPVCQIADITGVYGITFWVTSLNALAAMIALDRFKFGRLRGAGGLVAAILIALICYGFFRMSQRTTSPGPVVMVVQPSYPQSNSGEKGASIEEILDFHLNATTDALKQSGPVDLIVWSETMMPELNEESRKFFDDTNYADLLRSTPERLSRLAADGKTGLVVGSTYAAGWKWKTEYRPVAADRRNSAYFFDRTGRLSDLRYDKIHIVPFGEYLPFQTAFPPLYRLFVSLSPYGEEYTLTPGAEDALTTFPLTMPDGAGDWRLVTPICFEDIDPALVARMFHGKNGKSADLIVNLTNDGWFKANEMPQHFQAALFRSIENRVPTARSVNTGISGFVDSVGRKHNLIGPGKVGVSVSRVEIDSRYTIYSRAGDVFAKLCVGVTAVMAVLTAGRWWKGRWKSG